MMRSLLIFTILLALLGIGTIWIIEKQTGAEIVPDSHAALPNASGAKSWYRSVKADIVYRWHNLTGKTTPNYSSVRDEKPTPGQPEIVKWQDAQGVWHYEYKNPGANSKKPQ